jgi:hypothetical protein
MIKKHRICSILLILVVVIYRLISLHSIALSQDTKVAGNTQFVEALATVDKKEATIGEKIQYTIRVTYKDEITLQMPEPSQQMGVFTVKGKGRVERSGRERDGYTVLEQSFLVDAYKIGRQTIPALKIKYKGIQGEGEIATNEVVVDIRGIIKEGEPPADIKDIIPPLDVPMSYKRLVLWIIAGIGGLSLGCIIYVFVNKFKNRQEKQEEAFIRKSPHEIAYELLEQLSRDDLIAKGLVKEYYYRITNIVRHYIEDRFGLLAPEHTTEEFLVEMARTNKLHDNHKQLMGKFLERCDMVKYAKYGPSKAEAEEVFSLAKRFIDETRESLQEMEVVKL